MVLSLLNIAPMNLRKLAIVMQYLHRMNMAMVLVYDQKNGKQVTFKKQLNGLNHTRYRA